MVQFKKIKIDKRASLTHCGINHLSKKLYCIPS